MFRAAAGDDPYAEGLLSPRFRALLGSYRVAARVLNPDRISRGFVSGLRARTRFMDETLLRGLDAGIDQVVILGTGFDARGRRFEDRLRGARLYEVDHPATAATRAERTTDWPPTGAVRVDVDFLRERPGDRLRDVGFDPERRAVVLWEGVTMYLDESAVRDTLDSMRSVCAPGSLLAFDAVRPRRATGLGGAAEGAVIRWMSAISEPLTWAVPRSEVAALLDDHGWATDAHELSEETAARHGLPRGYHSMHFVRAVSV